MTQREPGPFEVIAGMWQLVRAEFDGERVHELVTTNTTLTFGGSGYEVRFSGEIADQGSLAEGAPSDSPTLILVGKSGPNAGKTIRSIYQVRGAWMRICYGLDGNLPNAFSTADGTRRYLATYKRVS